ncbi:MAG: histidine--tRNA ligase [Actinomycetia bacterium]|nr:histidine--tRNA ligase [Actinomycetes bacterium]
MSAKKENRIRAPRGTSDYLPDRAASIHGLDRLAGEVFSNYGYRRIITPTFEDTALFTRSIGEASDIVRKEMYTFEDQGGRSLTLRPEATAPVVRAFIEHNLGSQSLPVKLYYFSNMFRYERPQAGRFREFWQLGVEALGSPEPSLDAEVITLAADFLRALDIREGLMKIGSMGDENCRPQYTLILQKYLEEKRDSFCPDCGERLKFNPLRVFDCKNPECQKALADAPKMIDYLCDECRDHFDGVGRLLKEVGIEFSIDPMLVRGFDYYTRTTFEIQSSQLGAQNALGGGGRYDRLVSDYGGKPTPAVGFALGIERLLAALKAEENVDLSTSRKIDVFLIVIDNEHRDQAFKLAIELRRIGLSVEVDYMNRSTRSQMKLADKMGAEYALILGPDEMARGEVVMRNLSTGEERPEKLSSVADKLGKIKGFE